LQRITFEFNNASQEKLHLIFELQDKSQVMIQNFTNMKY